MSKEKISVFGFEITAAEQQLIREYAAREALNSGVQPDFNRFVIEATLMLVLKKFNVQPKGAQHG